MGKAVDLDVANPSGRRDDDERCCDAVRGLLTDHCNFQIGWGAQRTKALEPSEIAPTWVHMDVRCYTPQYLEDHYFVTSSEELDSV
jgi:hypothetical protein